MCTINRDIILKKTWNGRCKVLKGSLGVTESVNYNSEDRATRADISWIRYPAVCLRAKQHCFNSQYCNQQRVSID